MKDYIKFIVADGAPSAIGPYSQGVLAGDYLFVSGQIPVDPANPKVAAQNIEEATHRVLENILSIVDEAGGTKESIVKVTVFLSDMDDFARMNSVYAKFFGEHRPARAAVEVAKLPRELMIEMDAIAYIPRKTL